MVTGAVTLLERSPARLLVKRPTREDAMRLTHKALATLTLGLALVGATTAAAAATPPHLRRNRGWATYRFGSGACNQLVQRSKEGSLMATARRRTAMIARRPQGRPPAPPTDNGRHVASHARHPRGDPRCGTQVADGCVTVEGRDL